MKKRVKGKSNSRKRLVSSKISPKKKNMVLTNFFTFVILLALSLVLYYATEGAFYKNLFYLSSLVFGALTAAFLIVILIFFFMDLMKKK